MGEFVTLGSETERSRTVTPLDPMTDERIKETITMWQAACTTKRVIDVLDQQEFGPMLRHHRRDAKITLVKWRNGLVLVSATSRSASAAKKRLGEHRLLRLGRELSNAAKRYR
jgi:hypothetical protein